MTLVILGPESTQRMIVLMGWLKRAIPYELILAEYPTGLPDKPLVFPSIKAAFDWKAKHGSASDYIVAVENGKRRALNAEEERELSRLLMR